MSLHKIQVGQFNFVWKTIPRGPEGVTQVQVNAGEFMEVRWRRDAQGIWIILPQGVFGFDLHREQGEDDGELGYRVSQRESGSEWARVSLVTENDKSLPGLGSASAKKGARVRAQMPGKIIRVMATQNQVVQKDQAIVVMEAMKMENEIRAPRAGKISQVHVTEGQTVESGADLIQIDVVSE